VVGVPDGLLPTVDWRRATLSPKPPAGLGEGWRIGGDMGVAPAGRSRAGGPPVGMPRGGQGALPRDPLAGTSRRFDCHHGERGSSCAGRRTAGEVRR
jgi:hypothetical protein